jgi:protein involved in polysaccharide export with SLBB domain
MTLQAGDIVFIPVTGPMVAVAGNVRRPAIYELKDQYDLQYLFNLAGGIVPTAYTQQIQVERVIKSEKRIIFDIDDKKLERAQAIRLQDADLVKVFSIVDTDVNAIYLHGNVKRPGKYEYKAGMRLKDVIKSMDDILPETYFEYAMIKRLVPPSMDPKLIPFKPELLFADADEKNNLELMPQDNIYIFNQWFFQDRHYATIQGETRGICNVTEVMGSQASPAIGDETKRCFMALTKSTTIKDLILNAGGLTDTAYLERGQLIRVDKNRNYETIYFNVARAMAGDPRENLLIRNEDRVVIHSVWEQVYRRNVNVDGDVNRPGQYQLTDGMTVKDLIFKSGNILESAYVEEAELSSLVTEDRKSSKTERRSINLQKALEGDPDHNLVLRPNDRLFVKKIPDWGIRNIVNISGEVPFPGRYSMHKSEKLSSLLERAGGYTAGAYLRGAIFTRHSVKKLQQEGLEDMANRMERDLLSQSSEVATSLSLEEVKAREVEMQQKKKFIETFRQLKATGRLTIHLANLRILKGSDYDLELEDGDSLHIPPPNRVVNVMGSVMAQASYIYLDKLNYKDYISMAGGYTRYADPAQTFVLKVDGSARKLERKLLGWNEIRTRWEFSNFGEQVKEIEPGDIIVVPERFEHIAWLREIRDITQILMNTAVTAGVVIKLF